MIFSSFYIACMCRENITLSFFSLFKFVLIDVETLKSMCGYFSLVSKLVSLTHLGGSLSFGSLMALRCNTSPWIFTRWRVYFFV